MIDRYSRPRMASLWTLQARFQAWLEVEIAVCEAWNRQGRVPDEALAEIKAKAAIDESTVARILEIEETTRHDVIAFLTAFEEKIGPAARFVHLGCTSSDIVDTALGLTIKRAGAIILEDLDLVLTALKTLAHAHKGRLAMGRTHGIHAEPISFGQKIAGFYAEFTRHKERVRVAWEQACVGKLSGAVGTYALLAPSVEKDALDLLGLAVDPVSTQIVQRDRHAHFMTSLALLGGGVERLCVELRHLQRTEVLEAEEGFSKGQKGSSAMPHKKNPISAENLTGLSRLLRTNSLAAMENQALWHERDISHSSVERVILPDSTILADYILNRLAGLVANLKVNPENIERNLNLSQGLYSSQRVLTALIDAGMDRQKAYETVQAIAMDCWNQRSPFPAAVRASQAIAAHLPASALDDLFDPRYYLRHEDEVFRRVFGE